MFVSPALGCPAACAFCYLPSTNEAAPTNPPKHNLVDMIQKDRRFIKGPGGTLISLGCLSEPLAPHSIRATLSFLERAQKWRNPIQLATRWVVPQRLAADFLRVASGCDLVLFHSMSTVNRAREFERGTSPTAKRLEFFSACAKAGLRNILYIKPFISGVTTSDVKEFVRIIEQYRPMAIVVGPMYSNSNVLHNLAQLVPKGWNAGAFSTNSHPVGTNAHAAPPDVGDEASQFAERLRRTGVPVLRHSVEFFWTQEA